MTLIEQEDTQGDLDPTLYASSRKGWVKNYRSKWQHPSFKGRTNHIVVFDWLVSNAVYDGGGDYEVKVRFKGENITLVAGQLTCGSFQISKETGVKVSTVHRVINDLVNDGLIEKQTDNKCSLITVTRWNKYQGNEKQIEELKEERMGNREKTIEKPVRAKEESKELKKLKEARLENINEYDDKKTVTAEDLEDARRRFNKCMIQAGWGTSEAYASGLWEDLVLTLNEHWLIPRKVTLMIHAYGMKKNKDAARYFEDLVGFDPLNPEYAQEGNPTA